MGVGGGNQKECFIFCDPYTVKNLRFKVLRLEYDHKNAGTVALSIKW